MTPVARRRDSPAEPRRTDASRILQVVRDLGIPVRAHKSEPYATSGE